MVKTYEEANREVGEERGEGDPVSRKDGRGTSVQSVPSDDLKDRDYSKIFKAFGETPDVVREKADVVREEADAVREEGDAVREEGEQKRREYNSKIFKDFGDTVDVVREEREQRRREYNNTINVSLEEDLSLDYQKLLDKISEINEIDLSELDQEQLLALIAEQINSAVVQLVKIGNQNSGLAALLDDIAGSVQTPFGISLSGVNDIDKANISQPVVRGSDGGDIEAKVFKIRASSDNTASIWLGDENVEVGRGIELGVGDELPMNLDLRQDQLYMVSEKDAQEIEIIGLV